MSYKGKLLIASIIGSLSVCGAAVADTAGNPHEGQWAGAYGGIHGGYEWGETESFTRAVTGTGAVVGGGPSQHDLDGGLGGLQVGYSWQMDRLVYGVEASGSLADIDGQFQFDPNRSEAIAGGSLDWLASVRGRLGYAHNDFLFYGTGGVAFTEVDGFANNYWRAAPADDHATGSESATGLTGGAGITYAVTDRLRLSTEYRYYSFSEVDSELNSSAFPPGVRLNVDSDIELHSMQFKLNYQFDML